MLVLTGAIHTIFTTETYGDFRKRVLWLKEINVKNPNTWAVEFYHDDGDILGKFSGAEVVTCEVEVLGKLISKQGREFVINIFRCHGIKKVE